MTIQNGLLNIWREEGEMAKQADIGIRMDLRRGKIGVRVVSVLAASPRVGSTRSGNAIVSTASGAVAGFRRVAVGDGD